MSTQAIQEIEHFLDILRKDVARIHGDLLTGALKSGDQMSIDAGDLDGRPEFIEWMLGRGTVHDSDYLVFRNFDPSMGTIFDIGANWGYSVGSIRATGCNCPILSFEVIEAFSPVLDEIKNQLADGQYDYIICGLGDEEKSLTFYTPVLNNSLLTALTTAHPLEHLHAFTDNVVAFAQAYLGAQAPFQFRFAPFTAQISTIDTVMKRSFQVDTGKLAAIKIDVEGFEPQVLHGAVETLQRDLPLIIAEGGNDRSDIARIPFGLGYQLAIVVDGVLIPVEEITHGANMIFFHPDHAEMYRGRGILAS